MTRTHDSRESPEQRRWLNVELVDSTGAALVQRPFSLAWSDGTVAEGQTGDCGEVSVKVPEGVCRGRLVVGYRELELELDTLAAADTVHGAQERLNHLNFFSGPVDGVHGDRTRAAVRSFQRSVGLDANGDLDQSTIERLVRAHGV